MWNRMDLKMRAKHAFAQNRGACIGVAIIVALMSTLMNVILKILNVLSLENESLLFTVMILACIVLYIFILNAISVSECRFFVLNTEGRAGIGAMADPVRSGYFGNVLLTMFVQTIFVSLWSFLLIVPGIMKFYEYRMIPYLLAEYPDMERSEAFRISKEMMTGQKWNLFVLDMSFLGWHVLGACTCGLLNVLYVSPYYQATVAEVYRSLK